MTYEEAKANQRGLAKAFAAEMRCNCDLDNWEPERDTGHSHVCRIHQAVKGRIEYLRCNKP